MFTFLFAAVFSLFYLLENYFLVIAASVWVEECFSYSQFNICNIIKINKNESNVHDDAWPPYAYKTELAIIKTDVGDEGMIAAWASTGRGKRKVSTIGMCTSCAQTRTP